MAATAKKRTVHQPNVRASVRRMRREGASIPEIVARHGVPKATVGDWVHDVDVNVPARCELCGELFMVSVRELGPQPRYCCLPHRHKAWVFRTRHTESTA